MLLLRFDISAHVLFNCCREPAVDPRTLVKGKEAGDIHSISCKRPEEIIPKFNQPFGTKFPSIGSKRVAAMHPCPSSEKGCVILNVTIAIFGLQMIVYLI